MALPSLDDYFPDWKEREALAEAMIPLIGRLYRNNVVTYCYGKALNNQSVTQLMKAHRYVRQVAHNELSEFESYPILEALSGLDLGPSSRMRLLHDRLRADVSRRELDDGRAPRPARQSAPGPEAWRGRSASSMSTIGTSSGPRGSRSNA